MNAFIVHELEFVTKVLDLNPEVTATPQQALREEAESSVKIFAAHKCYRSDNFVSNSFSEAQIKVEFCDKWLVSFYALGMLTPFAIVVVEV